MSAPNEKLIRALIDLGSNARGHRVDGSNKADIKNHVRKIIAAARNRRKNPL